MQEEFKNAWHHVRGITSEEMRQAARECEKRYGDILYKARPVSAKHPPLSMDQKAAQYNPFAALTGFEEAIDETGRLTQQRFEPDADQKEELDRRMQWIQGHLEEQPAVIISYFIPDLFKEGGEYVTAAGNVKKIDRYRGRIVFTDGREIPVRDIFTILSGAEK